MKISDKIMLLRMLRKHISLSAKRSPIFDQNRWAKFFMSLMFCFIFVYLIFISVPLSLAANDSDSYTSYEFLFGLFPFILTLDFFFRFIGQQTPAQLIKPYSLLPISKYACIECFIFSSIITPNNFIWTAITIPYVIMTTLFNSGLIVSLALVLSFQLLVVINSQWYMLARTLINKNIFWWLLPVAVYSLLYFPVYTGHPDRMFDFFSLLGGLFAHWNPLVWLAAFVLLLGFVELNKRVQFRLTYIENNNTSSVSMKNVHEFRMFDRYGEVGEYLKLEVKSLMRNKNVRKSFIFAILVILLLSILISFTDLYADSFSKSFWVVYNFVIFGCMLLIKIMSAEGNYIDGLMIHKENIMKLLRAKYYFYSSMLFIPFLLMLPTVFTGKYSLLILFSMMFFTAGPAYCLLMQMAVYNRTTIPLNSKFVGRGSMETNYLQVVAELLAMFAPVAFISILRSFMNENLTFIVLFIIGLVFIITHKFWIQNIYKRFMKRRYSNMEGFRSSR